MSTLGEVANISIGNPDKSTDKIETGDIVIRVSGPKIGEVLTQSDSAYAGPHSAIIHITDTETNSEELKTWLSKDETKKTLTDLAEVKTIPSIKLSVLKDVQYK
jgi:hypothetical protein